MPDLITIPAAELAELKEQMKRLSRIVDTATEGIWVLGPDARTTFVNARMAEMIGYKGEEMTGRPITDFMFEEDAADHARVMENRRQGVSETYERRFRRKDGALVWTMVSGTPVFDDDHRFAGAFAMFTDITARKRADLQLVESEQKYRSLADSCPDNIVRYDANTRRTYVNRSADETMGLKLSSRIGLTPAESGGFPAIDAYHAKLQEVIRSGRPDEMEVVVPGAAGEPRTHNVRFVAERDRDGRIIGALAFGRDVTDRKEAARERQKYLDQLRQNLEDAVAAIAATVEARDPYTAGHQRHVAALAAAIAEEMGAGEEEVKGIHLAGTIHDLGKIKVPAEILARPGQLSEIEVRLIQLHPEAGWEILKGVEFPWPIAKMVLEHHERLDGSGYPRRLVGEQISFGARILAVADAVEAMATHRPYRPSRGVDFALSEIERARGVLFDTEVVDACLRLFREKSYRFLD